MIGRSLVPEPPTDLGSETLLFLWRESQVEELLRDAQDLLRRCQPVALTLDVRSALVSAGLECQTPGEDLSLAEIEEIALRGHQLREAWIETWGPRVEHDGIRIPEIDREAFRHFFRDAAYVRKMADKVRGQGRTVAIPGPLWRAALYYVENDTPGAILAHLFEAQGIPVTVLMGSDVAMPRKRHPPDGVLKRLKRALRPLRYRPGSVGVCVHGLAFPEELVRLLSENGQHVTVLMIRQVAQSMLEKLREMAAIVDLRVRDLKSPLETTWQQLKKYQETYDGSWPEVFANPHLDFHYRHYFAERWPRVSNFLRNADRHLKRLGLTCLITSNLTDAENWALVRVALAREVPVLLGLHGGWPDPDDLFAEVQAVMTWSESQRPAVPNSVLHLTGALGYDRPRSAPDEAEREAFLAELGVVPERKVVLFLTTGAHTGLFPFLSLNDHLATLEAAFALPEDLREEVEILVKPKRTFDHPGTYDLLRRQAPFPENVTVTTAEVSLDAAIQAADVIVMLNVPTTAYLNGVFSSRPLIFVQTTVLHYCGQTPVPPGALTHVDDRGEIWPSIRRLLGDAEVRQRAVQSQWNFVRRDMPVGETHRRILDLVASFSGRRTR